MISVVLYGRNDSYGYNLHKRAALSLNCIAELLTHDDDEILFVDYNTPDDFPTFPEAIQDTLTPRARKLLRILRVRPGHHQRFKDKTHLVALEPVARNVAVRRSNPANRWILSTNTDMVFVPRKGRSLSDIAAGLADGYYHLPRFELPESMWESLNRMEPAATIGAIEQWGRAFHLNEIVYLPEDPSLKYDGPGDFQLILRDDLFRISGFHEEMLLGWHVDWNIARRLYLAHGKVGDLVEELFGYHCDHTRQVTPAHRSDSVQNDIPRFIYGTKVPELPAQSGTWGLAGETIEEFRADTTSESYIRGLRAAIGAEMTQPSELLAGYDKPDYEASHVLPFLTDILASYPRDSRIGWFGSRRDTLVGFAEAWRAAGFVQPILVAEDADWLGPELPANCAWTSDKAIEQQARLFVFDWGVPVGEQRLEGEEYPANQFVSRGFRHMVRGERHRLMRSAAAPRRFIGLNAVLNRFETLVNSHIGAVRAPLATRIRQGYLLPPTPAAAKDLLPVLHVGTGRRDGPAIASLPDVRGYITYGPYLNLDAGRYRLTLTFAAQAVEQAAVPSTEPMHLEVFSEPYLLGCWPVADSDLAAGQFAVDFALTAALIEALPALRVEFRLFNDGKRNVLLTAASLEELPEKDARQAIDYQWQPLLTAGPAAQKQESPTWLASTLGRAPRNDRLRAASGQAGYVAFGPHVALPPGRYETEFTLDVDRPAWGRRAKNAPIVLDVAANGGEQVLAQAQIAQVEAGPNKQRMPFEIPDQTDKPSQIEFRIWSDGTLAFAVRSVDGWRIDRALAAESA